MNSPFSTRFRPLHDPAAASIYETIQEHDEDSAGSDIEDRAAIDHTIPSTTLVQSRPALKHQQARRNPRVGFQPAGPSASSRVNVSAAVRQSNIDDVEDDVPASLLIEDGAAVVPVQRTDATTASAAPRPAAPTGQSAPRQLTSLSSYFAPPSPINSNDNSAPPVATVLPAVAASDPRARALWRWANVENLDNFLADVYDYYTSRGFWSILLQRILNLLTLIFVIGFCLFLTQCIDYAHIRGSTTLNDILVPHCAANMGFVPNAILWITTFICISKLFQYVTDLRRLRNLHDFFLYLLNIPETEIQSISWQEVVSRLMALRDSNPNIRTSAPNRAGRYASTQNKQRMDAHDIANRLMRKDNYMVAMINKDILDTSLLLPLIGRTHFFTKSLQWHLSYCIMDFVFDHRGQIRQLFLKDTHRKALSEALRRRFVFAGTTSMLVAPFLIIYNLVQNFFEHFNEYQKEPAQIGSRQYNLYAQWKFREFNELEHLFERRLKMSYPFATRYINQFPKDKTVQLARFVTFISGALVSILGLATILDQENFLGFEITSGRTTIFYLGVFGSIWAVARGMLPDDHMVYDSSYSMEEVIEFTHYRPAHWEGRLHTVEVKSEFERLYQMQIVVALQEVLGMIMIPFVLCFTLPHCSERIIDFFREFTVHVDGLGYVCSYAEFNFKKIGQTGTGGHAGTRNATTTAAMAREEYYASKDRKLEQSYWGFMNDYARNPKTDVRYAHAAHHRQRPSSMSPLFTGVSSSPRAHRGTPQYEENRESSQMPLATSRRYKSRTLPAREGADVRSPMQSMLLDPHHQPTLDEPKPMSRNAPQPNASGAAPNAQLHPVGGRSQAISSSTNPSRPHQVQATAGREDKLDHSAGGEFGSWNYDDQAEDQSESEEDVYALTGNAGGVLGLIKQFQKAQGDDKRAGPSV